MAGARKASKKGGKAFSESKHPRGGGGKFVKGSGGPTKKTKEKKVKGDKKDPAFRAARSAHYAKKAMKAREAHDAAPKGSLERSKHSLLAVKAYKGALKHAKATEKLAPGSDHAKKAREHATYAKNNATLTGATRGSGAGQIKTDKFWGAGSPKTEKTTSKTTTPKTSKGPKKDNKSPAYRAHRAEHYAMKAEAAAKAGNEIGAIAGYKKALKHAKATSKLSPGGSHALDARNAAERAKFSAEKLGAKLKPDKFFKPKASFGSTAIASAKKSMSPSQDPNSSFGSKAMAGAKSVGEANHASPMSMSAFGAAKSSYAGKLSSSETSAVLSYSGASYNHINSDLRQSKGTKISSTTTNIDSALKKHTMSDDTLVYRGAGSHPAVIAMFKGKKPGDTFTEHAYSSTSVSSSSAFSGVKFHITVPKGMRGAPIPSHHSNEKEILLPRGTKFRIDKLQDHGGGKTTVHVTVVDQPH